LETCLRCRLGDVSTWAASDLRTRHRWGLRRGLVLHTRLKLADFLDHRGELRVSDLAARRQSVGHLAELPVALGQFALRLDVLDALLRLARRLFSRRLRLVQKAHLFLLGEPVAWRS